MTEQFLGCTVSLEVGGGLGFYQGQVKTVNPDQQTITLIKVLHNGKPSKAPEVTLSGPDILSLKVLYTKDGIKLSEQSSTDIDKKTSQKENLERENVRSESSQAAAASEVRQKTNFRGESSQEKSFSPQVNSPVKKSLHKRKYRASVGESLASGSFNQRFSNMGQEKNPMSEGFSRQGANDLRNSSFNEGSYQRKNQESRNLYRRQAWLSFKDESTFGNDIDDDIINTEFDFERNLALFDKQAVIEELQNLKPDLVRQTDKKPDKNYRCDQNVLSSKSQPERQIIVPAIDAGEVVYATDSGLLVPSINKELRQNLLSTANQHGLTNSRQLEMIGRGATEIILSVIGGSHRLDPGNSHQSPVVIILCGAHMQGAAGVNCGRQLESQGVQTVLVTPPLSTSHPSCLQLFHEMQLYSLTSGSTTSDLNTLPSTVDLIVDARLDIFGHLGVSSNQWYATTNSWVLASRAPVIALDPPSDITIVENYSSSALLNPRIRLCPALPLAFAADKGKVYLININIPIKVFAELDIKYASPFAAKMVIPLHPCE